MHVQLNRLQMCSCSNCRNFPADTDFSNTAQLGQRGAGNVAVILYTSSHILGIWFSTASGPDLWNGNALEGVNKQHFGDEVSGPRGQVARQVVDATLDLLEQVGDVLVIKGQTATQQSIQDDAAAPYIYFWASIQPARDDLQAQQTVWQSLLPVKDDAKVFTHCALHCGRCQEW